jgi:hypothetical protein
MNARDALKLPMDQFKMEVSRVITPKPWPHDYNLIKGCCPRCNVPISNGAEWLPAENQPCTVPPKLTGSLADIAFDLRDKAGPCGDMLHAMQDICKLKTCKFHDVMYWSMPMWFAFIATPQEQIACALVALGLWEVNAN